MTGLFNIHTVFGSLSPKQSEQEESAVCFLPCGARLFLCAGGLGLSSPLLHPTQMAVSHPLTSVSYEEVVTTLKAALIDTFYNNIGSGYNVFVEGVAGKGCPLSLQLPSAIRS